MAELIFRFGEPSDLGFVIDSFVHSFSKSPFAKGGNFDAIVAHFRSLLDRWQLLIATVPNSPDVIVGWILHDGADKVAHFLVHKNYDMVVGEDVLLGAAGIKDGAGIVFPVKRGRDGDCKLRFRPWIDAPST